ncbi:MAG: hypothetical protein M1831_005414 [Alyxoria varia]|nr:MAG: hypothetical protein M1831_005414 [Alyxoria varia]
MTSSKRHEKASLPASIYPAFCFKASPTYNKWVKLTAADVHALRREPGFEGQNVFFHLNHPLRYVYLCGPVVAIDFITSRYVLFTLDDSSGANVEIKIERIPPLRPTLHPKLAPVRTVRSHPAPKSNDQEIEDTKETQLDRKYEAGDPNSTRYSLIPDLVPTVTDTTISNVKVVSRCADPQCYAPHVAVDDEIIDIATVIKAKGSLQIWNSCFQLKLERIMTTDTLDEEVRIWEEYAQFARDVLARPWQLTSKEVDGLENEDKDKAKRARERERKREAKRELHAQKKREHDRKEAQREAETERKRREQAEELDGNALDRVKPRRDIDADEDVRINTSLPMDDHAMSGNDSLTIKKKKNKRERKKRRREANEQTLE